MKDKQDWVVVIKKFFVEGELPDTEDDDHFDPPTGYRAWGKQIFIQVDTRAARYCGDLLGLTELCLVVFLKGRRVAFVDYEDIIGMKMLNEEAHALSTEIAKALEQIESGLEPDAD